MKVLCWDVETSPLTVTTWQLWKPVLGHDNIVLESGLICGAWKWLGSPLVEAVTINPTEPRNDRPVVEKLHEVLSEADVIVAHNGDKFDLKKFRARAVFHGLPPIPPVHQVDTLKVARKYFGFNSNRLDYLGQFLGLGRKKHTSYGMWLDIMNGDAGALEKMVRYNKQDVLLLEKVYKRLRPYMGNHPNGSLYSEHDSCPTCGSKKFRKRGIKYYSTTTRQQYQCNDCGHYFSGVRALQTADFK